jgi:ABC-type nitrate/sulfonate/bicarbonate transport system ATPase subunit
LVTHDLDEALLLADRLLLMTGGRAADALREWPIREIFAGSATGRDRRSKLFLDIREEMAESLAGAASLKAAS